MTMKTQTQMHKTVSEWRKNWLYVLCMFLENNYENVKETEVLSHERIRINADEYKVDINDYTGSESNYIFFNVSTGRLVIQRQNTIRVERFDVEVV